MLLVDGARPPARVLHAPGIPYFDKILHLGAHGFLTLLLALAALLASRRRFSARFAPALLGAFAADSLLGLAVELTQYFHGRAFGRQFELADLAANALGAALAIYLVRVVVRRVLRAYINERKALAGSY